MLFNDRRTIKNPAVAAAVKAGSIKATENPKAKKEMWRVNKPMTRLLAGTASVGRNVKVKPGSKKEARLQKRQEWATSYGDKQMAKYRAPGAKTFADGKAAKKAGK
jgi:hypothetical protein